VALAGHGRFGGNVGVRPAGFGFGGPGAAGAVGPRMAGPAAFAPFGLGARGFGGAFAGGPGFGGGSALTSDVLTPAAAFLGTSVSALATDLAGGKTLAQEASAKNKQASDLIDAIVAAEKTNLDNEVSAGWITSDQETALLQSYRNAVTGLVNGGPSVPRTGAQPGGLLQSAATFLGISVADLQTALRGGKTLADEATAAGKTPADLVTALEAPTRAKLDAAVSAKTITQAQEDAILARLTTMLTNLVNGTGPAGPWMGVVQASLSRVGTIAALTHRR